MKQILLWIWCFPQNLVGLIVKKVTKAECKGDHYWFKIECGSVSLGEYIFLCPDHYGRKKVLRHEKGHRVQSRILGWLYLPIIAIPSMLWALYYSKHEEKLKVSYYWFPTEKWADKIANIKR